MLEQERQKIDELDQQIVSLLEERLQIVSQVAKKKAEKKLPVLDAKREGLLLEKIAALVSEPVHEPAILAVYEEILTSSKQYQQALIQEIKAEK